MKCCLNCPDRTVSPDCHMNCPKYLSEKEDRDNLKAHIHKQKGYDRDYYAATTNKKDGESDDGK